MRCVVPVRLALAAVAIPLLSGCSGPGTYPVTGQVVWSDGQPARELAGGLVSFEPSPGKAGASGGIGQDGSFRLSTHRPGDGAVPGRYRIAVLPPAPVQTDPPPPALVHPRFLDVSRSQLEVTVEAKANHVKLTVERNKQKR